MLDIRNGQTASVIMVATAIVCTGISGINIFLLRNDDWGYGFFVLAIFSILLSFGAMKRPALTTELSVAYLARLGMCLLCILQNDGDADGYAVYAERYAEMSLGSVFQNIPTGAYLYSWVISFFFRMFGSYYTPVRAMNMAISMCCVYIMIDIAEEIYKDPGVIKRAAIWMALFPNLIRFSSYFANREPMLMFFMLLYLKHSYRFYKRNTLQDLALSIVFLIPAMILHTSMIAMIALTVFIILTREGNASNRVSGCIGKATLAIGICIVFVYMLVSGVGTEKFEIGGGVELSVAGVSSIGNLSAEGRAAYLKGINFSNPILTILFLPVRMLYFMYTPFVWMLRTAVDFVGLFDALLYIYLSVCVGKKMKKMLEKKYRTANEKFMVLLFFVLVVVIAMFAAVTSNYGTAIRHRCKLFPLLLLLTADRLEKSNGNEKGSYEN